MNLSRRTVLASAAVAGGGLVVGFSLRGGARPWPIENVPGAATPNAFVQITPDNTVRFFCPRDEMGQGVTTGLATLIGEELDIDPRRLVIEMAGAHPDYANPVMGVQATGGSTSMKGHYRQLRQVGADVRALLINAAAAELDVPVGEIATDNGFIVARGARHPYGAFAARAAGMPLPEGSPLKGADEFRYIGKESPRLDGRLKSTGAPIYGIDVELPDLHHAVVRRSPVAGGVLERFDASRARAMPGVVDVVPVASGVAVVAKTYWQARQAAETLEIDWTMPELARYDSARIRADYQHALDHEAGDAAQQRGDLEEALGSAARVVEAQYWAPYLAHAPMEPMNAVVRIGSGEAELWTGSQGIGAAQGLVARVAGLDASQVRAHSTYLGGAFGRRATLGHVVEAAQAALATGKPVKVLWSREDDIKSGVYRPASLMRIKAAVDDDGVIALWQAKRVGGNMTPQTLRNVMPGLMPGMPNGVINQIAAVADRVLDGWVVEHAAVEGLFEDYDFPNGEVRHVTRDHGLPLTFWRSVGHSFTAFAKESMVDELAVTSGIDPVRLRLDNTRGNPRLNRVVEVAGERMRAMTPPSGHFLGLAAHGSFGSYVAEVAEVSVAAGKIRVHKVLCVIDCGLVVNPDVVRAQMEGAIMYGLTAALYGNLEIEQGEIRESNFHDYPILRMNEAPSVEVVMVDSGIDPTGVGEPGLPPIAPAVANAVFRATGQRLRSLPLRLA